MVLKFSLILLVSIVVSAEDGVGDVRLKRSLQPGAPNINKGSDQSWQLDPNIERDEYGNVRTDVNIKNKGANHNFDAGWSKVVRGPSRAKPNWHVGGTYRWRRSLQPGAPNINRGSDQSWQLDPNIERDEYGNVRTDVNIKNKGANHNLDAGWSKVVRGPSRAKPTWHVGGTYRWRRSLQPGAPNINKGSDQSWQLDPNIERDEHGNVRTDVNIKNKGANHKFDAGWSKVVRGPSRAKPTWHVGGTYRWRRSLQPGAPNINKGSDQSWQLDPNIERDEHGNVRTDVNIKNKGANHKFDAGWSKVVRGPSRAKPTWHVGGTYRWRRSLQPGAPNINKGSDQSWQLDPNIERDEHGNVRTDVNIKNKGANHNFDAGWSKVVRGPSRAKPTWHVGGTYRWRRSLHPTLLHLVGSDEDLDLQNQFEPQLKDTDEDRNNRHKRSSEDSDDDDEDEDSEEDEPWRFKPNIERDEDGNTNADINLKRHGDNHDFEASWSKVLRGPNRAKPTWHVGGTFIF